MSQTPQVILTPVTGPGRGRRTVWPKVIGIISTCLGGMGVACGVAASVGMVLAMTMFPVFSRMRPPPRQPATGPATRPATQPAIQPAIMPALVPPDFPDWSLYAGAAIQLVTLCGTVLLLIAGIHLIRRRPSARTLHVAYAVCAAAAATAMLAMQLALANSMRWPGVFSPMAGIWRAQMIGMGIVNLVLQLAYPVFLLVWFSRSKIRQEVRGWGRAEPTYAPQ